MDYNLLMIIVCTAAVLIGFLPTLPLMFLPAVKRLHGGKRAGMWLFGIGAYLMNVALVISWAGDIIQNRAGDLSVIAFYGYAVLYIAAPCFYGVFFRTDRRAFVYPIIIAAVMGLSGIALVLVPLLYGVNTEFGTLVYVVGSAFLVLPQLANAALYATLSRLSYICWDTDYID